MEVRFWLNVRIEVIAIACNNICFLDFAIRSSLDIFAKFPLNKLLSK
jgi:hypothetical protein